MRNPILSALFGLVLASMFAATSMARDFVVEEFFNGPVLLRGDLWIAGRGTRELTVNIGGEWDGKVLTLYEDYKTSEGVTGKQTWTLTKTGTNRFIGSRDKLLGKATMTVSGNQTLRLYTAMENFKGQDVPVSFVDRMTLFDDGVVRCISMGFLAGVPVTRAEVYLARPGQQHLLSNYLGH